MSQYRQHRTLCCTPAGHPAAAVAGRAPSRHAALQHRPDPVLRVRRCRRVCTAAIRSVGPADRCSFENALFFEKLHPDTLFFIFYYQPGTYQQYCPPCSQLPHPPVTQHSMAIAMRCDPMLSHWLMPPVSHPRPVPVSILHSGESVSQPRRRQPTVGRCAVRRYLAARELKRKSWRFHKKCVAKRRAALRPLLPQRRGGRLVRNLALGCSHTGAAVPVAACRGASSLGSADGSGGRYATWFQRHEEPSITTDEYEQACSKAAYCVQRGAPQHATCSNERASARGRVLFKAGRAGFRQPAATARSPSWPLRPPVPHSWNTARHMSHSCCASACGHTPRSSVG